MAGAWLNVATGRSPRPAPSPRADRPDGAPKSPRVHTTLRPRRPASRASGNNRIVGVMSASGSYDTGPPNRRRGATMGPPACSAQSSPVVFRSCCCTRLQGLSAGWNDWREQKVFLIRKRSQVRVLDRPLAGSRNSLHLRNYQVSGCWRLDVVRVLRGATMEPPAVTCEAEKRSWFRAAVRWARTPENAVRRVLRELAGEPSNVRLGRSVARRG